VDEYDVSSRGTAVGTRQTIQRMRNRTGKYRIWLDQSFWIDVIEDRHLVAAEDFQGRPGCSSPHKIVLYSLSGGRDLILQLSGGVGSHVRLTIVPMPADTPRSLR
jgi:hypothetical protein